MTDHQTDAVSRNILKLLDKDSRPRRSFIARIQNLGNGFDYRLTWIPAKYSPE